MKGLLKEKIQALNILLTHPCVADLRAFQENRDFGDIPEEVIKTLEFLRDSGADPSKIKLYTGTPTCFAIKTQERMLLNPYPYTKQAMDSPCFELSSDHPIYEAFSRAHFGAFNTALAMEIQDFDSTIQHLRKGIPDYSDKAHCILGRRQPSECRLR